MNRVVVITGALVLFGAAQTARAQYIQPQTNPYGNQGTSPYINLLNPNVNAAVQYQGIVKPQLQAQTNYQQLQSEITTTRSAFPTIAPPRNDGVADTGYAPARFMQYQRYYFTLGAGGRGGYQNSGNAALGRTPQAAGTMAATFGGR